MKHILPTETINKVLSYLATQTYSEVVHLIAEIKEKAAAYFDSTSAPIPPVESTTPVSAESVAPLIEPALVPPETPPAA